jgi:hypothetical protein
VLFQIFELTLSQNTPAKSKHNISVDLAKLNTSKNPEDASINEIPVGILRKLGTTFVSTRRALRSIDPQQYEPASRAIVSKNTGNEFMPLLYILLYARIPVLHSRRTGIL